MNLRTTLRRTASITATSFVSAALLAGLATGAQAATPQHTDGAHAAAADHQAVASSLGASPANIYSHGNFSIQFTVHNDTDQPWTLDTSKSTSSGHWATRPQATLAPGASDTVSGYSDSPWGEDIDVVYTLPNGEYAALWTSDDFDGPNWASSGIGSGWDSGNRDFTKWDSAYSEGNGITSSGYHDWADASIKPATAVGRAHRSVAPRSDATHAATPASWR